MSLTSHLLAVAAGVAGMTLYQRARQSGAFATDSEGLGAMGGQRSSLGDDDMSDDALDGASGLRGSSSDLTGRMGAQGAGQGSLSSDTLDDLDPSDDGFGSGASSGGSTSRKSETAGLTSGG